MIGLFDSGIGGLTIAQSVMERLPQYTYLYLGDTARAPYGDHSQEIIFRHTTEALTYLFDQGCTLVLLACNTASAEALRTIQKEWLPQQYPGKNVLGVIRPLAEAAAISTRNKRIGVMATRSTVASHAYQRELRAQDPKVEVYEHACRLLVPLIEEGYAGKTELRMILKKYMRPMLSHGVDTVILGCTHYGLIAADIKRYAGSRVKILDSGSIVAEKFAEYLIRHPEYESQVGTSGTRSFATTGDSTETSLLARRFWGSEVPFQHVQLSHTT